MKTKTKKRLIICLIVVALLAAGGYGVYRIAMNYAGDKAVDMLVSNQINNMLDSGEVTLSDLEEIIAEPSDESPMTSDKPEIPAENTEQDQKEAQQGTQKKPQQTTKTRFEVVKEASDKVQESVERSDKDKMMKLISSRLSSGDVKYLMGLIKGGLTPEEISAAARLAYSRFSAEEITQVKTYWHRYKNSIKRAN